MFYKGKLVEKNSVLGQLKQLLSVIIDFFFFFEVLEQILGYLPLHGKHYKDAENITVNNCLISSLYNTIFAEVFVLRFCINS